MKVSFTAKEILDTHGKAVLKEVFLSKNWTNEEWRRRLDCISNHKLRVNKDGSKMTARDASRYYPMPGDQNDMFPLKITIPIHWVFDVPDPKFDLRKKRDREAKEKLDAYNSGLPYYLEHLEIFLDASDAARAGII